MTTLKEAIESLRYLRIVNSPGKRISEELLGQYKGIIPKGKNSASWLKTLRAKLYGKAN